MSLVAKPSLKLGKPAKGNIEEEMELDAQLELSRKSAASEAQQRQQAAVVESVLRGASGSS
eukprot:8400773-Karenia_brevis.AAC.1